MADQTERNPITVSSTRGTLFGSRLNRRQSALGRGLAVLMGSPAYGQPGQAGPADESDSDGNENSVFGGEGGLNRSALLSRLQGSHRADLTRGFQALLTAGLVAPELAPSVEQQARRSLLSAVSSSSTGTSIWNIPPDEGARRDPTMLSGSPAGNYYEVHLIRLASIRPNPFRVRTTIRAEEISGLAKSISELGILQPMVVMPAPKTIDGGDGGYLIVSGERRRQAALKAGLVDVPAIVRDLAPGAALHLLLTEDVHSTPLHPLDQARLYDKLTRDLLLTVSEIAARLGVPAQEIESRLALLKLESELISSFEIAEIDSQQAELLATVSDPTLRRRLWRQTVRHGWPSDRMAAALTRWQSDGKPEDRPAE